MSAAKGSLWLHLPASEKAWLKGLAKHEGIPMTQLIRDFIRDSMKRELAAAGIEAGLRCYVQDCFGRPAVAGLCSPHAQEKLSPVDLHAVDQQCANDLQLRTIVADELAREKALVFRVKAKRKPKPRRP